NDTMLIVDEANYLLDADSGRKVESSLNYLRDIYDTVRIPIVLVFTGVDINYFKTSQLAGFMQQFRGRQGFNLQIPERVLRVSEVIPVLHLYVPDAGPALIDAAYKIAAAGDGKIRTLTKYLKCARVFVAEHGGKITPELLYSLQERYESGGAWPEE
ncbi:MAG: TniB family NTP-binding protein, partial [Victivallales bacterium]|nr:TniB family NTP-binding protein [Victivallales bacterium]